MRLKSNLKYPVAARKIVVSGRMTVAPTVIRDIIKTGRNGFSEGKKMPMWIFDEWVLNLFPRKEDKMAKKKAKKNKPKPY